MDSRCARVELEDIDQERLDIDVFLAFFFLFIRPRDLHCTDKSLLSKRRSILKQSPLAKLLCLNISNELEISSF